MNRAKNAAVLISLLWVAVGCATVSYQEPTSGPRARIRFVADYQDITVVHQFDDEDCKFNDRDVTRLRSGFIGPNTNRKSLGIPLPPSVHENARTEIFVVAGQPFHGMFMGLVTSTIFSTWNRVLQSHIS